MMNQAGANIQYPYHELPLVSTDDRLGFWALYGIYEEIVDEMTEGDSGNEKNKIEISCADRREDEK